MRGGSGFISPGMSRADLRNSNAAGSLAGEPTAPSVTSGMWRAVQQGRRRVGAAFTEEATAPMHRPTRESAPRRPLLTVPQFARQTTTSERSVWRWIAAGHLPVVRLGRAVRIDPDQLDAILAAGGLPRSETLGK